MKRQLLFLILAVLLAACTSPQEKHSKFDSEGSKVDISYAKGFTINDMGDRLIVEIVTPYPGAKSPITLTLRRRGELQPDELKIPISRIVCTSTTHLPLLELLGKELHLVGFPGIKYVSSEVFNRLAAEGKVQELGVDTQLNVEGIIDLQPDVVMAFSMGSESRQLSKLIEMGMPVAFNGDYLEETVLGRAEWIKFMAAFFDQLDEAEVIFGKMVEEYRSLQELAKTADNRPTVMSGVMYGDAWYLPGGKNWGASLINDAGGLYLWDNNPSSGWIEVGFEGVLDVAKDADFWIGVASITSLGELASAESRYREFAPFKNKKIYNYTGKMGPGGGYAIMESGYAMPHVVLADMIKILHPELMPEYDLYFYEQLH